MALQVCINRQSPAWGIISKIVGSRMNYILQKQTQIIFNLVGIRLSESLLLNGDLEALVGTWDIGRRYPNELIPCILRGHPNCGVEIIGE